MAKLSSWWLGAVACCVLFAGCKSDASYAEAKTPPPSDPKALHAAEDKLEATYQQGYGSKFGSALTDVDFQILTDLQSGNPGAAVGLIQGERVQYSQAIEAARQTVIALSKNTTIVTPIDHDDYTAFYTAETDRLNSKASEYQAFLDLKPDISHDQIQSLLDLIADAKVKEGIAEKLAHAN